MLNLKGRSIDISEAGIGIQTDHPLSPGHILWFDGSIEDKAGFVRWCSQLDNEYRVGIELDRSHVKYLEEATDTFNNRLVEIERRCENPEEKPEELLKATLNSLNNMVSICESF